MASYVVLERRPAAGRRIETELVRDDFSVLALIFPLIWLLVAPALVRGDVLLLVSIGIGMIGEYLAPGPAMVVAGFVVSFFVALEGPRGGSRGFAGSAIWRPAWSSRAASRGGNPLVRGKRNAAAKTCADDRTQAAHAAAPAGIRPSDMVFGFAGRTVSVMRVAIIDYGSGNLRSAVKSFERSAREAGVSAEIDLTSDADRVATADRIVLPGVGAYADCRAGLDAVPGMVDALNAAVVEKARPFFGICVGMQLMSARGLEKTVTNGLGWIAGDVVEMTPSDPTLKIPQIGWNTLDLVRPHALFDGIRTGEDGLHAYFVHSYHLAAENEAEVVARTDYGGPVTAAVGRDNMFGTQFHPEKSQTLGLP
jgi:glutamine amidotransferase